MYNNFLIKATSQAWRNSDPILRNGELGFETDTNQFKIGNGIDSWNTLIYYSDNTTLLSIIGSSEID